MSETVIKLVKPSAGFDRWIEQTAEGDKEVESILQGCLERFRMRYACLFISEPADGYQAMVRLFRSAAVLQSNGVVRSAELFTIRDLELFQNSPQERQVSLASTTWDNRATLFCSKQPSRRTREIPSIIDFDGSGASRELQVQAKQFELLLNRDFHRHPQSHKILVRANLATLAGIIPAVDPCRPIQPHVRQSFLECLKNEHLLDAGRALENFRKCLDQLKTECLEKAGANGVDPYNWLAGSYKGGIDAQLATRRTQAIQAYPLIWSLARKPTGLIPKAIETALPLGDTLAELFRVEPGTIKRMNGLSAQAAGLDCNSEPAQIIKVAKRIERMQGKPPATQQGWKTYFSAVSFVEKLERTPLTENDKEEISKSLIVGQSGKWDDWDPQTIENLGVAEDDFSDLLEDFSANVGEPSSLLYRDEVWMAQNNIKFIVGRRSLKQLADACAWWHENQVTIRNRLQTLFPLDRAQTSAESWPPLHNNGPWTAVNGLKVHCLYTKNHLLEEHQKMKHCVNTYDASCLYGGAHILSVRSPEGEPLGTVEVSQEKLFPLVGTLTEPPDRPLKELPPGVVQFRAQSNGAPSLKACEALWGYISAILTGGLKIETEWLEESLKKRRGNHQTGKPSIAACYDTSSIEAIQEAWRIYSPILSKGARKAGLLSMLGVEEKQEDEYRFQTP